MIDPHVLRELLSLGRCSQSTFQVDHFVIARNGMSVFGVLKQAHREMCDRWGALKTIWIQHREAEIGISEGEEQLAAGPHTERERLQLVRARMLEESLADNFEDAARLFLRCYQHGAWARAELIKKHGELSRELLDRLDLEEWKLQLRRSMAVEMRQTGALSQVTLDLAATLPAADRKQFRQWADTGARAMHWEWLWSYEYPQPESLPPALDVRALRQLVGDSVLQLAALPAHREGARIPRSRGPRPMTLESSEVPVS